MLHSQIDISNMSLSKPFDKCFILKLSLFAFQLAIVLGNDKFSPAVVSDDAEIWSAGDGMLGEQVRALKIDKEEEE